MGSAAVLRARPTAQTMILLEHTAGQGTEPRAPVRAPRRDPGAPRWITARRRLPGHLPPDRRRLRHLLGRRLRATFEEFDRLVGIDRIRAFHLNDSKKPCGSRVDRHEHIGRGCLGLEPFRRLLNDPRFAALPMLLETPKLDTPESRRKSDADPWDLRNLRMLRRLTPGGHDGSWARSEVQRSGFKVQGSGSQRSASERDIANADHAPNAEP